MTQKQLQFDVKRNSFAVLQLSNTPPSLLWFPQLNKVVDCLQLHLLPSAAHLENGLQFVGSQQQSRSRIQNDDALFNLVKGS